MSSRSSIIPAVTAFLAVGRFNVIQAVLSRQSNSMLSGMSELLLNGDRAAGRLPHRTIVRMGPRKGLACKNFWPNHNFCKYDLIKCQIERIDALSFATAERPPRV